MPRGPSNFKQRDAAALIRAARQAGVDIAAVTVDRTGKITIMTGKPEQPNPETPDTNEWDRST